MGEKTQLKRILRVLETRTTEIINLINAYFPEKSKHVKKNWQSLGTDERSDIIYFSYY